MGLTLVTVVFFAFVLLWIALPFLPGLRELRERRDIEPLRVVRDSEVDVVHFARGLRRFLDTQLAEPWSRARRGEARIDGALEDGTRYLVLGAAVIGPDAFPNAGRSAYEAVVVACGDLELPSDAAFMLEVFSEQGITIGTGTLCRAVLAEGDMTLGAGSQVMRWAHASGVVDAAPGCELYGRLSAGARVRLGPECRFERLHAPIVEFGEPIDVQVRRVVRTHFGPDDLIGVTDEAAGRWRIKGDLVVPEGGTVESDVVVTGRVEFGDGAMLLGSIKSHGELRLGRGVEVQGSVVCQRDIHVGDGCRVHGPVIAERTVSIGAGVRIGTAEVATTVSAARLVVSPGAVVHGTVWAHQGGVVQRERAQQAIAGAPAQRGAA